MIAHRDRAPGTSPPSDASPVRVYDLEDVYAAHVRSLTLQVYAYTGDLAAAQDIVQEAFCRALPRWERLSRYDDPVAWLRRVCWNLATSRWRRLRAGARVVRPRGEATVAGPDVERLNLVAALAKLPATQRRAVVLYYLADLTTREIAHQEGVAESTVRVWLHRGRAALATLLTETGSEHPHV